MDAEKQLVWDVLSTSADADFKEYRKTHSHTWLTKDRRILLMKNMETSHIISCINMLETLGQETTAAYDGLIEELKTRGPRYE